MRFTRRFALFGMLATALSACASKFQSYSGPEVTRVIVLKEKRKMYLLHGNKALRSYDIALGFAPAGDKKVEGDGRTPEGHYRVDRRNPDSRFHLSIGIDYPNRHDIAEAKALGEDPGGDIFIHGEGTLISKPKPDWTWGCVAISNDEMEEVYAMVPNGTFVSIFK
ncbi:L,D-transpeptidase family protein [uncultured Boseongicola sp.]|jgi:murein L,D-transpeptidase YafK|uniref:L,D-transpeptidase family protein n=1 Tax=uncultured Boseongicola sp. TaxID=1648499 RepID=UPI00260ECF5A|nr:L,D-transpeptidase family protein [uncultured Boseongicola sp.]